ncbi:MAG: LamG domain-containing protein, partial [Candidatus Nanohalobium sp.]
MFEDGRKLCVEEDFLKLSVLALSAMVLAGMVSAIPPIIVNDLSEWNNGGFTRTSADRNDNSGVLGLGYLNGTSSDSLVGFYRLDRNVAENGGTVLDYSGNGLNGETNSSPSTGREGVFSTNAFSFAGGTGEERVTVPNSEALEPTQEITVSLWVKRNGSQTDYAKPVWYGQNSQSPWGPYGFEMEGSSDTDIHWHIALDDGNYYRTSPVTLNDGEWHHLVGTFNGTNQSVYLDGQLMDSQSVSGSIANYDNTYGLGIGDRYSGGQSFSGNVDEVRIYNRSLTSSEIRNLYFQGGDGFFDGVYGSKSFYTSDVGDLETYHYPRTKINASISSDTRLGASITSRSNYPYSDTQTLELEDGNNTYGLDLDKGNLSASFSLEGNSTSENRSWEVFGVEIDRMGVGLKEPADAATKIAPVNFTYFPECSAGCSSASLYTNVTEENVTNERVYD